MDELPELRLEGEEEEDENEATNAHISRAVQRRGSLMKHLTKQNVRMTDLVVSEKDSKRMTSFAGIVRLLKRRQILDEFGARLLRTAEIARYAVQFDNVMKGSSVLVIVRLRPFLRSDPCYESRTACVNLNGATITVTKPAKKGGRRKFKFDAIVPDDCSQDRVYMITARRILVKVMQGYNGTVFAYGQTGSGKTHTMIGGTGKDEPGIIPRVSNDLLHRIELIQDNTIVRVRASFVEIYRENISDLLVKKDASEKKENAWDKSSKNKKKRKKKYLSLREHKKDGVTIPGVTMMEITSRADIPRILEMGNENRKVAGHALNARSSRSHAVFTLYVEQSTAKGLQGGKKPTSISSKFHLIDLAGSERANRTGATGELLKEGAAINMSLSALGNVIKSLTSGKAQKKHIPYRDSVLTRLLQDSLGGSASTLMICNIAPGVSHFPETLSSLQFAERVKKVKNAVVIHKRELTQKDAKDMEAQASSLKQKLMHMHAAAQRRLQQMADKHDMYNAEREREVAKLQRQIEHAQRQKQVVAAIAKATTQADLDHLCDETNATARK
eukprot:g2208.t1